MVDSSFFRNTGPYVLGALVEEFGGAVPDEASHLLITGPAALKDACGSEITFCTNNRYLPQLSVTKAAVCIVGADRKFQGHSPYFWEVEEAYAVWAKVLHKFYPMAHKSTAGDEPMINPNCYVAVGSHIGAGAVLNEGCHISENCYIGPKVQIGRGSVVHHGCTITHSIIGSDCIIHPGVCIGQDGFGFAPSSTGLVKVPQLGRVLIGNNVEIGSNTCIDRGAIGDTVMGDNCKLDNLVQIGHNVVLGRDCIVVAQVGIAGSTVIGAGTMIGGQAGIAGHLRIGKNAQLAARSGVIRDIEDNAVMGGTPAVPIPQWHRQNVLLQNMAKTKGKV